ncbi:MAG: hypothetical protein J2P25_13970 [Nocardiopsaceae bacterium]|nr:hypothetical protein [Nocardiopsaceae bacterium]
MQDAAPERSEGTDRTGAVRVALRRDGLPESIHVEAWWKDRIRPEALGAAVTEASQQAVQRRGEAWSSAFERAGSGQDGAEPEPSPDAAPGFGDMPGLSAPRPLDALYKDVIELFDSVMPSLRRETAPARECDPDDRPIVITLAPDGQMSCTVDTLWARRQSGAELSQALGAALATAREELWGSEADASAAADRASRLLAEIRAAGIEAVRSAEAARRRSQE